MKFSVIIPTYNRAMVLSRAIESVLEQTFLDWELLIIDDGSTDNTAAIVAKYQDSRVHYHYQKNAERSCARNSGIDKSQGTWICFLDSDDCYLSNHLEVLNKRIGEDNRPKMFVTAALIKKNNESYQHPVLTGSTKDLVSEIWSKFILSDTVCIHHSILEDFKFDIRFSIWEDTHLWSRIAVRFEVLQLTDVTCVHYVNDDSSVVQGFKNVDMKLVRQYLHAINDVCNDPKVFADIEKGFVKYYIIQKLRMYLYQARINKQMCVALRIYWMLLLKDTCSIYTWTEFPKIFLNVLGIHRSLKNA